jgi:hypothetical protein
MAGNRNFKEILNTASIPPVNTEEEMATTSKKVEPLQPSGNQYFKETLNKLATTIDLTSPVGLAMSAAFDKYVEKMIKPIYPKGTKIRQTSAVDDATGVRTVDWYFKDTNHKIEQAVRAAVDNFTQSWGKERGLLDNEGNPVPEAGSVPMQVSGITQEVFNGTRTRVLNPRTAAAVARAAIVAGGDFVTDKNTGISTWSVPDNALTPEGEKLSRVLRAQVREGDKRWLEGRVALSSLAEGASPASAEERAVAMQNRNYRAMLAKHKAMTPEQEEAEVKLRLQRSRRMAQYRKNYEEANPNDPQVRSRQKRNVPRTIAKIKQTGSRAVNMARNSAIVAISSILSAFGVTILLLGKINAAIMDIGNNVRRKAMSDMRYNFDPEFTRQWERFAEKRGFDKELLSQAAGGIAAAWSSPLNYTSSNFDALAPYLQESTQILVRQAAETGDKNVLPMMSAIVDDLVGKSLQGRAGTKSYTGQSRMTAAFTENMSALQSHNGALAKLMQDYWYDLTAPDSKFKTAAATAGKEANFETWLQQALWNPEYKEQGNGMTNPPVKTAAERTLDTVNNLKISLDSLRTDVMERIAGSVAQVAEDVRSKISNLLARYFPAFAMKEKERAVYLNTQALANAENNLPGYKATAEAGLRATGYMGSLEDFKPIYEGIIKRDPGVLARLPRGIDFNALDAFVRYYAPAYYETEAAVQDILKESTEMKNQNYVPRVIVYDAASNATRFTSLGMAAGFGLQNAKIQAQAPRIDSGGNRLLQMLWGGVPAEEIKSSKLDKLYSILDFVGLQIVSDTLAGTRVGERIGPMTKEERAAMDFNNKVEGTYNRYKSFAETLNGYEAVNENGMLLLGPNRKLASDIQTENIISTYHAAENELYNYLALMYEMKNPDRVLDAYDKLALFYHRYGHFSRATQSPEMNARILKNTEGLLFGEQIAKASFVTGVDEIMEILREKREMYIHANHLEDKLLDYQASQTLPIQALKQNLTNDATIPMALIEQTNAKLLGRPDLPNNIFDVLRTPGMQRLVFDVDEEAIKNKTMAVTNVYIEMSGRPPVKLLEVVNSGLPRDVHVEPGQEALNALLEAFISTQ